MQRAKEPELCGSELFQVNVGSIKICNNVLKHRDDFCSNQRMKHLQILFLSIVLALGAAYSVSAVAARGGHGGAHSSGHSGGHSGWHGHGSAHFGVFVGPGWYGPYYPYYYPPYYYPPYYYPPYYPPVSMPPPTYIERAPAIVPGYWYYCGESQAYYPTVGECPEGWQQVAPQPAR